MLCHNLHNNPDALPKSENPHLKKHVTKYKLLLTVN